MDDIFHKKYNEFARELHATCPELTSSIQSAVNLGSEERKAQFKEQVLPFCSPSRDSSIVPEFVLPGVPMPKSLWTQLSHQTHKSIQEYLTLLSFTFLIESSSSNTNSEGAAPSGNPLDSDWAKKMMDDMKSKMSGIDFAGLSEKIAKLFGGIGGIGGIGGGIGGIGGIPQLPEKFMKGQIAKLAEEIVKEFRMEDFGIDPAVMESAGNDPTKALNIIMELFMKNPQMMQGTIQKLTKKLQQKVQSGALRPQELVAEAEELMKTFSDNPDFVGLMESFRQMFGFEDTAAAQAAGRDGDNRLSLARSRLRKKLEAKKAGKGKK